MPLQSVGKLRKIVGESYDTPFDAVWMRLFAAYATHAYCHNCRQDVRRDLICSAVVRLFETVSNVTAIATGSRSPPSTIVRSLLDTGVLHIDFVE